MITYKGHKIEIVNDGDGDWSLLIDENQERLITKAKKLSVNYTAKPKQSKDTTKGIQ